MPNDIDPAMNDALAERIFNLGIRGASVVRFYLNEEAGGGDDEARPRAKRAVYSSYPW